MKRQIKNVTPKQAAKVFARLNFFLSLPLVCLFEIPILLIEKGAANGFIFFIMIIITPFAFLVLGYIHTLYGAWLYNNIAKNVGGIEFEVSEHNDI